MFQTITGKPFCPIAAIAAPEAFSAGSSRRRKPRPSGWCVKGGARAGSREPSQRCWEDFHQANTLGVVSVPHGMSGTRSPPAEVFGVIETALRAHFARAISRLIDRLRRNPERSHTLSANGVAN